MLHKLFFSFWYLFRRPPWDTGVTPPEVQAFIKTHPPGRALDLGCGTGTNAITLAQHGWQVTGVDFAPPAIQAGKQKARRAGVQVDLRVGDVTRLENLSGEFDLILDIGCFHNLSPEGKAGYAARLPELLRPQGVYLLYAFFKDPQTGGTGLSPEDLAHLNSRLQLEQRLDGSERGRRASAWFTFRQKGAAP